MAGGNKNHDPKTGRFTTGSGLNKSNATKSQRAVGFVKDKARVVGQFGLDLAAGVAVGLVQAAVAGASEPIKKHASTETAKLIKHYYPKLQVQSSQASDSVIRHGRSIMTAGATIGKHAVSAGATIGKHAVSAGVTIGRRTVSEGATAISSLADNIHSLKNHMKNLHQPRRSPGFMHDVGAATLKTTPARAPLWQHAESGHVRTGASSKSLPKRRK